MFKVNNEGTRTTPLSKVFIANFEHISHFVLVFLLLTLSRYMPAGVQVVKLCSEHVLQLRGHRESPMQEFTRDGNFISILKGFAKIDVVLYDHRSNDPKNAQ